MSERARGSQPEAARGGGGGLLVHLCVGEGGVAGSERAAQRTDCPCLPRAAKVSVQRRCGSDAGARGRWPTLQASGAAQDARRSGRSAEPSGAGRGVRGAGRAAQLKAYKLTTWRRRATASGWWQSASMTDTPARAAQERD